MKNMVYFAIFGNRIPALSENTQAVFGGFGFDEKGSLRVPYVPPSGAAILLDDSILPADTNSRQIQQWIDAYHIDTIIFDFEKPKNEVLCRLIANLRVKTAVVPPQYAGIVACYVLVPAYQPRVAFEAYLQTVRRQYRNPMIDLAPIRSCLKSGVWAREDGFEVSNSYFSAKQQCMYRADGNKLHFFDTKRTLLSRAAASGLPCLLPYDEFAALT